MCNWHSSLEIPPENVKILVWSVEQDEAVFAVRDGYGFRQWAGINKIRSVSYWAIVENPNNA